MGIWVEPCEWVDGRHWVIHENANDERRTMGHFPSRAKAEAYIARVQSKAFDMLLELKRLDRFRMLDRHDDEAERLRRVIAEVEGNP